MLRNLNQTGSRGRICGTPHSGTPGSLIPAGGDAGVGYIYNDLSLPAENNDEFSGEIVTWPSGTLYAYEDSSFIYTGNSSSFEYQLRKNGVIVGSPVTVTLTVGSGLTITGIVGNAVATGSLATITQGSTIACTTGNAVAAGSTATISADRTITCVTGAAVAQGVTAVMQVSNLISCTVGNAVAKGIPYRSASGVDNVRRRRRIR